MRLGPLRKPQSVDLRSPDARDAARAARRVTTRVCATPSSRAELRAGRLGGSGRGAAHAGRRSVVRHLARRNDRSAWTTLPDPSRYRRALLPSREGVAQISEVRIGGAGNGSDSKLGGDAFVPGSAGRDGQGVSVELEEVVGGGDQAPFRARGSPASSFEASDPSVRLGLAEDRLPHAQRAGIELVAVLGGEHSPHEVVGSGEARLAWSAAGGSGATIGIMPVL
jgi:hypothetical protein